MNRYLIARSGLITTLLLAGLAALAIVALFGGRSGVRADTSGPNASGYVWIDSNTPDPVVSFEWVDASDGALSAVSNADDNYETVTLPFTFNFFGTDYTEVDISSNGFLSFDIGNECNDNYAWGNDDDLGFPIPHGDAACETALDGWGGNPLIAAWFDDLYPSKCGDVRYETVGAAPDRQFVVEFSDVCHIDCDICANGEGITFEIILFEGSNDIKVQYLDALFNDDGSTDIMEENNGGTATTGIDQDDSVGLAYHWGGNGETLSDNLAVLYTTGAVDLEISKTTDAANVKIGDEVTYTVSVTNNGPAIANAVTATDDLPDATTFVSATPSQGTCGEAAGVVTCDLGDMPVDGTATIDIVVAVTAAGSLQNSASVSAHESDLDPSNDTAVAGVTVGAVPTPTPTAVQLPRTGGQPGSSSDTAWMVLAIGGLAALAGGALVLAPRLRAARSRNH